MSTSSTVLVKPKAWISDPSTRSQESKYARILTPNSVDDCSISQHRLAAAYPEAVGSLLSTYSSWQFYVSVSALTPRRSDPESGLLTSLPRSLPLQHDMHSCSLAFRNTYLYLGLGLPATTNRRPQGFCRTRMQTCERILQPDKFSFTIYATFQVRCRTFVDARGGFSEYEYSTSGRDNTAPGQGYLQDNQSASSSDCSLLFA